ncbi:MAG: PAS domain S-box protein [Betaproteobacteria bacterium]
MSTGRGRAVPERPVPVAQAPAGGAAGVPPLLQGLWDSALPAMLRGPDFRVVDGNEALAQLLGRPRARLRGLDPVAWLPPEDRELAREERRLAGPGAATRCRMADRDGRMRWFTPTVLPVAEPGRPARWLVLLHDDTAEHDAREQARRADAELGQWFELSPVGMLVYDSHGLVLRSNAAFEALVDRVPEVLQGAAPALQQLLGWVASPGGGSLEAALVPGARAIERQAAWPGPRGLRRLWARLSCHGGQSGETRVMAVVQDRSAEEERDRAYREMGLLMDSGSIGVATFDPAQGWLLPPPTGAAGASGGAGGATQASALVGVSRDAVLPESRPDYERLLQALKQGEAADATYAVRHPELGQRWLRTRVSPHPGGEGARATSVITRDITDQHGAKLRSERLMHEMTTVLDSSPAGVAYLRGPALVRCNRRFERMLGFAAGAAAGASLEEILARSVGPVRAVQDALAALAEGRTFEAELPLLREDGQPRWYSFSVRRAGPAGEQAEAVAVLTDITRLKAQQAELEKSVRDRELMFNVSEVGIVWQRGTRIERANQAMAQLSGWSATELATLDPAELYADTRSCVEFEARIAQGLQGQGRFLGERLLKRRDGTRVWVQVAVRQVDPEDAEAGVISSFVDIDERRRARESLAEQAERTRAILDSVLVGIVTVSERGIEWMNRSARRMFAGELADFLGEPMAIVATPESEHPLRRTDWLAVLAEGTAETFECRLRGRDGREFWVAGNAVLSRGASGGRELTFALLDIERRRQAELRIAEAQASLQRVIETAPAAIALFDADTLALRQANQTAAAFLGTGVAEGRSVADVAEAALAASLAGGLRAGAASGEQQRQEWRHGADDAVEAQVWDCRLAPLSEPGEPRSPLVLLVASDVTEQRAAEQARLQAAIAQREVLVREVHHRIKNNLQGVAGLLMQTAGKHPEVRDILTDAVGQVQAIAQVYGLQMGRTGPLGLAGLLRAVTASLARMAGRTIDVQVLGEVPHELPENESIPIALTLNELVGNALRHGDGGDVRCTLAAAGDAVVLGVAGRGRLPAGFELQRAGRSNVAGLGLVRALLPRRSSRFALEQVGDEVVARVELWAPAVQLPAAAAPGTDR